MSNEQIAHDLAIAKLRSSDLETKELVSQYRKYFDEILSFLKTEPKTRRTAEIYSSPF